MRKGRVVLGSVTAGYFATLAALAFVPGTSSLRFLWVWPFLAFVPLGILLLMFFGRRRWVLAVTFAVLGSAWIEAAQSIWMPDGYGNTSDVVWASLGAGIGVILAVFASSSRVKSMRSHEVHRIVAHSDGREIPQD